MLLLCLEVDGQHEMYGAWFAPMAIGRRTHCHGMHGISHESRSPVSVVPLTWSRHKVLQGNSLDFCIRWDVHDTLMEWIGPSVNQLFHQFNPFDIGGWNIQGFVHASEPLSPWPAEQDLAFIRFGIVSGIVGRGVEEGEVHEGVRLWVAALEEERI